jgi:hypothetical protein
VAKLRDELNFATIDELVKQMKRDSDAARACLAAAVRPQRDSADKTDNG